jgi:hypothetical protein
MMPGSEGQGGQPSPQQAKQMMTQVIRQLDKLAQEAGIDLIALVQSVVGSSGSQPAPPPPPQL